MRSFWCQSADSSHFGNWISPSSIVLKEKSWIPFLLSLRCLLLERNLSDLLRSLLMYLSFSQISQDWEVFMITSEMSLRENGKEVLFLFQCILEIIGYGFILPSSAWFTKMKMDIPCMGQNHERDWESFKRCLHILWHFSRQEVGANSSALTQGVATGAHFWRTECGGRNVMWITWLG